jgi:hypothetical protein
MGAGLHGRNGLAPKVSYKLWSTYVLPRMLYGIEATAFKASDINKLEVFQRKILRQLQSLPESPYPANAAVYGLLGAKPIEAVVDSTILSLFGNICRNSSSVEHEIAIRQLAVKSFKSKSWFMKVREILNKYNLPSIYDVIKDCPVKSRWKQMVDNAVKSYWTDWLTSEAKSKSSMAYINITNLQVGKPHQIWTTLSTNPRDVKQAAIKVRLLTGTYVLQSNRARFNQHEVTSTCLLCEEEAETVCHFILRCKKLDQARIYHLNRLKEVLYGNCSRNDVETLLRNQSSMLQLLLDSSHSTIAHTMNISMPLMEAVEEISRKLCYSLHVRRRVLLSEIQKCNLP